MSLNPNAPPWPAPTTGMQHHSQHEPHYTHTHYGNHHPHPHQHQGHPMNSMGMPTQPHGGRQGMMGHTNFPVAMHLTHPHNYHNQRQRATNYNQGPKSPMPTVTAPSYKKANPFVILVLGYRKTGKTTVARRLAETRNFRYISLKPKGNEVPTPESFVSELVELLAFKNTLDGIVIDDAVVHNKFEPYYVQAVLQKHGLRIDCAVVLDTELDYIKNRDVDYEDPLERQSHPERYEFCASYLQGNDIMVIDCREKSPEDVANEAVRQLMDVSTTKETYLKLKEVELMPKCPLERNVTLATAILKRQVESLSLMEGATFPFSEPNYLLEYAIFARHAYALRSYMITPWMQGDKVSIIGYQKDVYIHVPSYNIIFNFTESPSALKELAKRFEDTDDISFILEATFSNDKLYISDLLALGDMKGSNMLVNEREEALKTNLIDLNDPEGTVCLLPFYPVESIKTCLAENPKASGVLFVNPDGVAVGSYDSRNYLYPLGSKKSVELRIWNGNFNAGLWTFDAHCEEAGNEKLIENIPVHVSDADVNTYCINDGNILECVREDYNSGPNKGRKGASSKHYVFRSRCNWTLKPTTVFKQEVFVDDPKWPMERLEEACAALKHRQATRPEEPKETDG